MTVTCKVLAIVACGLGFYLGESGAFGAPAPSTGGQIAAQGAENAPPQARHRKGGKGQHAKHHGRHHHRHHHRKGGGKNAPKAS